ncbi:hypothetical protein [Lysobacter gummosus]|uniref:hypothetical protein n=1 Tax=Lysobacter gummosus TaxID=262324 RepID=UPI00364338E9
MLAHAPRLRHRPQRIDPAARPGIERMVDVDYHYRYRYHLFRGADGRVQLTDHAAPHPNPGAGWPPYPGPERGAPTGASPCRPPRPKPLSMPSPMRPWLKNPSPATSTRP